MSGPTTSSERLAVLHAIAGELGGHADRARVYQTIVDGVRRLCDSQFVVVSHADIIKMVLAHFLGMHLDEFQRIVITPASISVLSLGFGRPYVGTMNDMAHVLQMEQERKQAKQAEKTA